MQNRRHNRQHSDTHLNYTQHMVFKLMTPGITILSRKASSIKTVSITTLFIKTLALMIFCIKMLSIMIFSIKDLYVTASMNDTKHK
jgi:hypothetical protein